MYAVSEAVSMHAGDAEEEPYPPTDQLLEKLQQVLEKADMEASCWHPDGCLSRHRC